MNKIFGHRLKFDQKIQLGMYNQIIVNSEKASKFAISCPFSLSCANRNICGKWIICTDSRNELGTCALFSREISYRLAWIGGNRTKQRPAQMAWMLSIPWCQYSYHLCDGIAWAGIWYHGSQAATTCQSLTVHRSSSEIQCSHCHSPLT